MGFVRTAALETQIQEELELCSARLQNGEVYKGKKMARLHKLFIKSWDWRWQEVKVLVKQELVVVCNDCTVAKGVGGT